MKYMIRAEVVPDVCMDFALNFAGEIEVDVQLPFPVKTEERFHRDMIAIHAQRVSTARTDPFRKVSAAITVGRCFKLNEMTMIANVMGRERIDAADSDQEGHQRGTDAAARTYGISFLQRPRNGQPCNFEDGPTVLH